ncbi:MAG TPA: L,D-transpeptidase [Chloroflexota bacterium]|jgi:hypothetical protein|nr:L,D-transpeptidase [Chloroflexota bacterium]
MPRGFNLNRLNVSHSRRGFLVGGSATLALLATAGSALADPYAAEAQWIANHVETRLLGADGAPVAWVPRWTRMRLVRGVAGNLILVWVPRLGLYGRVAASAIGPVPVPSRADLLAEQAEPSGPPLLGGVGLPGRVVGGANLRRWPAARPDTLLRSLGHNAPLRVLSSVEGDDGDEWYHVHWLDGVSGDVVANGYIHHSVARLPRLRYVPRSPDRAERENGRWFEADLKEPALLVAFDKGAPVWSTLTLKGTVSNRTPTGRHKILWRVANETMTSERVYPPIPRDAPGGYYLTNVLWTQYFTAEGASIHYNYWSSNWGYAGSHGCLGVGYNEARFAWTWAEVGTPVYVFA